jgi:DNA-nicking Smr family endonuclease
MAHRHRLSEQERLLFRAAVGAVAPLRHERVHQRPPPPPPIPQQTRRDERQVIEDMVQEIRDPAELETGEELIYARPGVPPEVLRRLRRGQFSVNGELDLHGMTTAVARLALTEFFKEARRRGLRCVRVIHGKGRGSPAGRGILKQKVNHWLRQRDEVLAFSSSRPVDGGTGAVYVLLKR